MTGKLPPEHNRARWIVAGAIGRGRLIKPTSCSACGECPAPGVDGRSRLHAHHKDHTKPLEVEWLCALCHRAETPSNPYHGEHHPSAKVTDAEADETFIGRLKGVPVKQGVGHKMKVLSLLDRTTGAKRSVVIENMKWATIAEVVTANVAKEAFLMTDEAHHYQPLGAKFAQHGFVNHGAEEYVSRANPIVHTNTIEGSFSIFKRGMRGIYQHCGEQHLHRYLAEFDFRYSNRVALGVGDQDRAQIALQGVVGKRLTYRTTNEQPEA